MKMAKDEAESNGHKVLFVCASKPLASMVNSHIGDAVDVKDIRSLSEMLVEDITSYQEPLFKGISHGLIGDYEKYNAIFVDEAQDFTEEWASIIRLLLDDPEGSRLGVFFDDVQVLRERASETGLALVNCRICCGRILGIPQISIIGLQRRPIWVQIWLQTLLKVRHLRQKLLTSMGNWFYFLKHFLSDTLRKNI